MEARTTAAPPPTPSTQTNSHLVTSAAAADVLSRLLHRLPPTLSSLPSRRSPPSTTSPPVISLSDQNPSDALLSASSQLGFFQLTNHNIPSQLASSSESEASSLFELDEDKKESSFPRKWPLGFEGDEDGNGEESFWLDSNALTESSDLGLASLGELTRAMEKLGLQVVEMLANAIGFENPFKDPTRFCPLMWLHEDMHGEGIDKPVMSGGFYPYVVGLEYQIRSRKCSLLTDSGWVTVLPQVDSVMVTIGDIAQVWSNGKLKKVKGKPTPSPVGGYSSRCISMWLLVTLPLQSTISPLLPLTIDDGSEDEEDASKDVDEEKDPEDDSFKSQKRLFSSFSFEDYARRVYDEPLLFKDPLDRYRI
ncbi:hypothetical protein Tsubulata_029999 [Turnera subulata]|uniref:Non-haem dioxygenase N-terminal domain-containing protein n=1 Tax=Turnera subulata TaxID=218843 RepID=A0A9Q0G099_9ROSI|nr:hypothetical protein Tsubulata_029999 [Turnera subulata]